MRTPFWVMLGKLSTLNPAACKMLCRQHDLDQNENHHQAQDGSHLAVQKINKRRR